MRDLQKNPLKRFLVYFTWIRTNNPPKWIIYEVEKYYEFYCNRYGVRPYNKIKVFKGDNFIYKVVYKTLAQGNTKENFYVKRRYK